MIDSLMTMNMDHSQSMIVRLQNVEILVLNGLWNTDSRALIQYNDVILPV